MSVKPLGNRLQLTRDALNHLSDLGGEDRATEAEKAIVRRAATLIVELEKLELAPLPQW